STQYGPRQYATISFRLRSRATTRSRSASGVEMAPGMWPAANSSAGRTSRTITSPRPIRSWSSGRLRLEACGVGKGLPGDPVHVGQSGPGQVPEGGDEPGDLVVGQPVHHAGPVLAG